MGAVLTLCVCGDFLWQPQKTNTRSSFKKQHLRVEAKEVRVTRLQGRMDSGGLTSEHPDKAGEEITT